jgi:alpha-ketoglutarate-dependent 2,4-dichlorophenoxyacetate dioxygenase
MPSLIQETPFKTITIKELHPTFGAEVQGVNFAQLSDEQFQEVQAALAKVSPLFQNMTPVLS